jgi:adenine-specific DNA methylase
VGKQVKEAAETEVAEFYPPDPDGSRPIAYIWARTVRCEGIGCGAEIPLVRSLWLSKKADRRRAVRLQIEQHKKSPPEIRVEVFQPKSEKDVSVGTVSKANATCPCCNIVLPAQRVCAQLAEQKGGSDVQFDKAGVRTGGAFLLAVALGKEGEEGREYRPARISDYRNVWSAQKALAQRPAHGIPAEPLPAIGTLGFRVQRYGMLRWGDLFTARQKLSLTITAEKLRVLPKNTAAERAAVEVAALALTAC